MSDIPLELKTRICDTRYSEAISVSSLDVDMRTEISIVISGHGVHRVFNETTECRAGDVYIVANGIPHGYFSRTDDISPTVMSIFFDPKELFSGEHGNQQSKQFCFGVFRDNIPLSYAMLTARELSEAVKKYEDIKRELNQKVMQYHSAAISHLTLLLISIGRYINMAETDLKEKPKDWITVSAATNYVLENYGNSDITLESIASSLYISKSHLSRIFSKVIGIPFADYIRGVRIEEACRLLRRTGLTNEEIVLRCGLKDVPTFYKQFKTVMGITPYKYRMQKHDNKGEEIMSIVNDISESLQKGRAKEVKALVQQAVDEGVPVSQILNDGLLHGMGIIGEKFKKNEVYVPEVLVAARAMDMGAKVLKPLLIDAGVEASGKVCIGTVQGDLHDIGKNLVKMMMEGKGLEVVDLGTDVAPETFVQTAIEQNCQVICCSALLTTTMDVMGDVVKAVEQAGIRDKVKIMVGGAPVTEEFCNRIGADRYTADAASAADAAVELCRA